MAWTSPFTWLANKIVTSWQLRVSTGGDLSHLYGIRPSAMTQSIDLNASEGREKGIVYQNTDDKARFCCIIVACGNTPYSIDLYAECDAVNPPTTKVAYSSFSSGYSNNAIGSLIFIVPPLYYYKVETLSSGTGAGVSFWFEWSL